MKPLRTIFVILAFTASSVFLNLPSITVANAAPKISGSTIKNWEGPKSGKEGVYLCTKKNCGGFAVVAYENDRMSRLQLREFERAQKDRKRFDRYFKLGFKIGNAFKRNKINPVGSSSSIKIGKLTAIGQAIKMTGKNTSGLADGYVVLLPFEKRQHTFAAIAGSPSKAKSLAIKFAKGLRF